MLDTRYRVEIPGGINLDAQVVGPIPRCLAFALDLSIRGILVFILSLASIPFGAFGLGGGFFLIFLFAIEWLYPVLFEVFWRGQTPGKRALGIAVINDDLTPVTLGTSMVRNLLRTVDFLPLFYLVGLVTMLCNRRFQRLGDLAAGTIVVHDEKAARLNLDPNGKPLPVNVPMTASEQQAIVSFAERASRINADRVDELAEILEPVMAGVDAEQLKRHASWIAGGTQ